MVRQVNKFPLISAPDLMNMPITDGVIITEPCPGETVTNKDYLKTLCFLAGIKHVEPDIEKRKLNITVSMDSYGAPSAAIVAFEGTPLRLPVFITLGTYGHPITINHRTVSLNCSRNNYCGLYNFLKAFINNRKAEWNKAIKDTFTHERTI